MLSFTPPEVPFLSVIKRKVALLLSVIKS